MDFVIRKDIHGNWWHDYNNDATKVNISDFEAVIDDVANTFIIQNKNGSNVPSKAVSISDVKVINQIVSNTPISFSGAVGLKNLLTSLNYTPYVVSGGGGGGAVDSVNGQTGVVIIPLDYLPLAGGTMDAGADIFFDNGSALREGTYDFGGNGGISRICSVDYEDMWQAGIRHVFDNNGLIRHSTNCFDVIPNYSFDNTLRFKVDSLWTLDDGTTYKCTDASTGAAVWEIYHNFIPTLQQVTDVDNITTNPIIIQGLGDASAKQSIYTQGVFELNDINGESGYIAGVANSTDNEVGFRFNVLNTINSDILLKLADGYFTQAFPNTNNLWFNIPYKPQGIYTLATLDDIGPASNGLPTGGTAGQILTKVDATDYNATWQENYADWTSVVKHTVKNNGSALITKGTAVYVTGSNGTNMLVGKASNATEAASSKTMGLMESNITTTGGTQTGFVITEGLISGLDTSSATAGDPVWLGVNGALIYGLANKPYAPAHLVFIGIVTKVSSGNGEIFVKVQNGFELKEIHDVDLITNAPTNNQGLIFETSSGLWKNKTIDKTLVGLGNVDNTSDVNKPVSTAQTTAINAKVTDAIVDGVTTVAPSQNAVFDALALKQNTATLIFDSLQKTIMRDNYFWFIPSLISAGTSGAAFGTSERISGASFAYLNNGALTRGLLAFNTTATAGILAFSRRQDAMILTGLEVVFTRKIQFNSNVSGQRFFSGISKANQFSAPTNVEPSTLTDIVGVCQLSSSTNMHVVHNDASGTATTIDLGSSYPCTDSQYNYYITIEQTTTTYIVTVERVTIATGASISTTNTLTTNIPNYATGIIQLITWISNNATAAIASYLDGGAFGNVKNQ